MKNSKLDDLKGKQPFRVPEGYMAGLTNQIMDRLPELPEKEEPQSVSLMDRIRPLRGAGWGGGIRTHA